MTSSADRTVRSSLGASKPVKSFAIYGVKRVAQFVRLSFGALRLGSATSAEALQYSSEKGSELAHYGNIA